MATKLYPANKKDKANWRRVCDAVHKLDFNDGRMIKMGWSIYDWDTHTTSNELLKMKVDHLVKDSYTIIIN
jgi:hypothetical protein